MLSMPAQSGALAAMGIQPEPIGTLEEVRKQGLDPRMVGSCAPPSPGVRGCAHYKDCPFYLKKYGGFRDFGPRYVGYYLQTHEGRRKEDFMSCYHFVKTLLARMRAGDMARMEGKSHEVIRVVAHEGQEIVTKTAVPVNELDKSPTASYHIVKRAIPVPSFPRPGELVDVDYEAELAMRQMKREAEDPEFEVARIDPNEPTEEWVGESEPTLPGEASAEPAPVKRGPGRPRKYPLQP